MTIKIGTTTYLDELIDQDRRDGMLHITVPMLIELRIKLLEKMKEEGVSPGRLDIEVERVMAKVMKYRQSHH
jgi:hypothetical protein